MLWLKDSSIGRKLVMSISGVGLVLFLLFHGAMNLVVIFSPEGYNAICAFLGANWYAIVATLGLAALFVIHILYAFYLTLQNRIARGKDRYAVTARQEGVSWASKNMLALGVIIIGFLCLHMYQFWAKMQLVELLHKAGMDVPLDKATNGAFWVQYYFSKPIMAILYLVWLGALWYHLTHGVWSSLHSLGLNNNTWMPRVKVIGNIVSTLVVLMFAAVVVVTAIQSCMGACAPICCAH